MREWHVDPVDLDRYSAGTVSGIGLASIESHLLACGDCRAALTTVDDDGGGGGGALAADSVWAGIVARVDRGPRTFTRSSRLLQVSLSSPPLALVTSLLAALLIAVVSLARLGGANDATVLLVVGGPLVPLATARFAFSGRVDPAGAMAGAVPLAASRVAAMRALVAVLLACAAGAVLTPLTTLSAADSVAWLLPALAASAAAVAIGTFVDSTLPTGVFALIWVVATGAWLRGVPRGLRGTSIDGLVTARSSVQVALVLLTAAAAVVAVANRDGRRGRWSL